jgi:uncharacterized NAD-dependent epimerase/dehydratase family protein
MTTAVELWRAMERRGVRVGWVATGQTGILLRGWGVAVDRVPSDFVGGVVEELIDLEARDRDWILVEGQGSIVHPAYGGVTAGLMLGALPDAQVLVHEPTRRSIRHTRIPLPRLATFRDLHEELLAPIKPAPVVAIALNTFALDDEEARRVIAATERELGLPVDDPVRFGGDRLARAILDSLGAGEG